jgi:hypothetical protein
VEDLVRVKITVSVIGVAEHDDERPALVSERFQLTRCRLETVSNRPERPAR